MAYECLGYFHANLVQRIRLLHDLIPDLIVDVVLEQHQIVGYHILKVFLLLFLNHISNHIHIDTVNT